MAIELVPGWSTSIWTRKTNAFCSILIFRSSAPERAIFRYACSKWGQNDLQNDSGMTQNLRSGIDVEVNGG